MKINKRILKLSELANNNRYSKSEVILAARMWNKFSKLLPKTDGEIWLEMARYVRRYDEL